MRVAPEQVQVLIVDTSGSNHAQLHTKLKAMRFSMVAVHDNLDESKTASMHFAGPTLVVMFLGGGATLTNFVRFFKRAAGKPIEIAFVAPVNAGESVQKTFADLGAAGFLRTDNSFEAIKLVERVMADSSRFASDEITTSTIDLFRKAPIGVEIDGDARPVSPVLESASTRAPRVPSLETVEAGAVVRDASNPGVRRRSESEVTPRRESLRSASASSEDSFVRRAASRLPSEEATGAFQAIGAGVPPPPPPPPPRPSGVGPPPVSPPIATFAAGAAAKRRLPRALLVGGSAGVVVLVVVVVAIIISSRKSASDSPAPPTPPTVVEQLETPFPERVTPTPFFGAAPPASTPGFAIPAATPAGRVLTSVPTAPTPLPTPGPFAAATPSLAIPSFPTTNDPFGAMAPPLMPTPHPTPQPTRVPPPESFATPVPVSPFTPAPVAIVEVQSTPPPAPTPGPDTPVTIADLRRRHGGQRASGAVATVGGIVTFAEGGFVPSRNQFIIQDDTGGLLIDDPRGLGGRNVREGDRVRVTGEVGEFRGMLQLALTLAPEVVANGEAPAPRPIEPRQFGEATEGQLIRVEGVRLHGGVLPTKARNANLTVINKAGTEINVFIDEDIGVFGEGPPGWFTLQGVLFQWGPNDLPASYMWVVYPRGWKDIIAP